MMRKGLVIASFVVFLVAAFSGLGIVVAGWSWWTLVSIGLALRVAADI